jgi:UDP-N-acetylglucosamine--N-acetylmuramyl-(pentapeptide) pyrophosphoryl-undecaprenol N-acetylglucosamine transferase
VRVVHQAGPGRVEETEQFYREMKNARVVEFIDDMAKAYGKADLVICRAGATTIAELSALGKPSVLIPYPYSAEGHQDVNARVMAENGAALYFQQAHTGSVMLGSEIEKLLKDEKRLDSMGKKAKVLGKPEAAERIAASLLDMVAERHDPVQGKCIKNS